MSGHDTLTATRRRATTVGMQQPSMFLHNGHTIIYPTAPGRVFTVSIAALSKDDVDPADITTIEGAEVIVRLSHYGLFDVSDSTPAGWPSRGDDDQARTADFLDALEQWADYCDQESARLDSLDEIRLAIERAA